MSKDKSQRPDKTTEIPASGSLGLLAYGHKGVIAWRKKRDAVKAEMKLKKNKT